MAAIIASVSYCIHLTMIERQSLIFAAAPILPVERSCGQTKVRGQFRSIRGIGVSTPGAFNDLGSLALCGRRSGIAVEMKWRSESGPPASAAGRAWPAAAKPNMTASATLSRTFTSNPASLSASDFNPLRVARRRSRICTPRAYSPGSAAVEVSASPIPGNASGHAVVFSRSGFCNSVRCSECCRTFAPALQEKLR